MRKQIKCLIVYIIFRIKRHSHITCTSFIILLGTSLPLIGQAEKSQNNMLQTNTAQKRFVPDVWHVELPLAKDFKWDIDDVIITHDNDVQIIYSNYNLSSENRDEEFYFERVYSLKQQKIVEEWIGKTTGVGSKAKAGPMKEGALSKGSSEDYLKTHAKHKTDPVDPYTEPLSLGDGTFLKPKQYNSTFPSCYNFNYYFARTDSSGKSVDDGLMLIRLHPQMKMTHPFCAFEGVRETYAVPVRAENEGGPIYPLGDGTYLIPIGSGVTRFKGYMESPYVEASDDLVLVPAKKLHDLYTEALFAWQDIVVNDLALERAAEVGYLFAKDVSQLKQDSKKKEKE